MSKKAHEVVAAASPSKKSSPQKEKTRAVAKAKGKAKAGVVGKVVLPLGARPLVGSATTFYAGGTIDVSKAKSAFRVLPRVGDRVDSACSWKKDTKAIAWAKACQAIEDDPRPIA